MVPYKATNVAKSSKCQDSSMLIAPQRHCSGWIHHVPLSQLLPPISPPLLLYCITLHRTEKYYTVLQLTTLHHTEVPYITPY